VLLQPCAAAAAGDELHVVRLLSFLVRGDRTTPVAVAVTAMNHSAAEQEAWEGGTGKKGNGNEF